MRIVEIPGPSREPIRAGALVRRQVRRALLGAGVEFTEDKGLVDSVFYVSVPAGRVLTLRCPEYREERRP